MLSQLDRWSGFAVLLMALLLPVFIYGAIRLPVGSSSVHEWLPDNRVQRQVYERFLHEFGSDHFVLISWEGCKVDDPRLPQFASSIQESGPGEPRYIDQITTTPDVLQSLTEEPLKLPLGVALRRLKGILVGRSGLCAIVAGITDEGMKNQSETIEHIYRAADRVEGLGRQNLRMAGTVYEAHAVDAAAERSLRQLVLPSMIIGIALACACLRSILAAMAVLIIAGVGTLLAVATVSFTGGHFSAVLIMLPTLVFMLTLSGAVHLMHYYVDAAAMHDDHLGSRAMLMGFKPSVLSSVTTALGMASLAASQLAPVRQFGLYSAFSLCVAAGFLLLAFPALSDWFYSRKALAIHNARRSKQDGPVEVSASGSKTQNDHRQEVEVHSTAELIEEAQKIIKADTHAAAIPPWARHYSTWMQRHAVEVSLVGLVLILVSFYGLMQLRPSTKFDGMFPSDSPTIRDMEWLEQNLGPIASVEVLVTFSPYSPLDLYQRIELIEQMTEGIRNDPRLGVAMSATTFLPVLPQTGSLRDVARRSVLRKQLAHSLPILTERGWVADTERGQVWRITAKVSATAPEDYGTLTQRVQQQVASSHQPTNDRPTMEITGLYPVIHATEMSLIDDLQTSFTVALVLITPVMMLIARGVWAGLLIMIPNVLPETLVFGMMAWMGFRLDIAGLLTASVAVGIAVNDTLHFVNWYARRLAAGDSQTQAIADTLSCCAGAMFHTMLISCCSMVPFLFAEFLPTRQFAFLMIAMLSSAILGDLVLLPGLLLSPLGRVLRPKVSVAAARFSES